MASESYLPPAEKRTNAYIAACVRVNLEQFRNVEEFRNVEQFRNLEQFRHVEQRRFSAA